MAPQVTGAEARIVFSLQEQSLAPYRIENYTRHQMLLSQTPCAPLLEHPRIVDEVPPGGQLPFAWEQVPAAHARTPCYASDPRPPASGPVYA